MSDPTPPGALPPVRRPERRAALPRDLADFLIELSIALHKHAMYPGGHPTLAPAAEGVARRLEGLLRERGTLSLGVARDQLVIEGVATDPKNPVLHDLASRLHRHHLGAVSFNRGVTWDELEAALKLIALESERTAVPLGLRPRESIPRWGHIQLFPLTFDRLELVGGADSGEAASVTGGRSALLWVGLARAALAAGEEAPADPAPAPMPEPLAFRPEPVEVTAPLTEAEIDLALSDVHAGDLARDTAEPAQVAKAIESHERGTAYDQVIVGYMLQIAEELKATGGREAAALQRRMSRLITALDGETLARLMEMGGDTSQRRQFILDASQGMAVDAVVELVRAATGTGAPVSSAMLRMLQKLGRHAERGPVNRRSMAETELRDQVAELVRGWGLADPNPDEYSLALRRMTEAAPVLVAAEEVAFAPEPERIVQMAIETLAQGPPLLRAVESLVASGRGALLMDLLEAAGDGNPAAGSVRERLLDPVVLGLMLSSERVDLALVDRLLDALGAAGVEPLLDILAESESRQLRRALIDRLPSHPDELRPALASRIGDSRWYVLRNLLCMAAELPGPPAVDAARASLHSDARVRREAFRVLFKHAGDARARAIASALSDADDRVRRLALQSVIEGGCPEAAVPRLAALASESEEEADLRVSAVRALGGQGGRLALEALLALTQPRRRSILDAMRTQPTDPVQVAAVAELGRIRNEPRAKERLNRLAAGRDQALAAAAAAALTEG
jgi:hypothetical protein